MDLGVFGKGGTNEEHDGTKEEEKNLEIWRDSRHLCGHGGCGVAFRNA